MSSDGKFISSDALSRISRRARHACNLIAAVRRKRFAILDILSAKHRVFNDVGD